QAATAYHQPANGGSGRQQHPATDFPPPCALGLDPGEEALGRLAVALGVGAEIVPVGHGEPQEARVGRQPRRRPRRSVGGMRSSSDARTAPTSAPQPAARRGKASGSAVSGGGATAAGEGLARAPSSVATARYGFTTPCPIWSLRPSGGRSAVWIRRAATCSAVRSGWYARTRAAVPET